jgi:copper(I)-binding protein
MNLPALPPPRVRVAAAASLCCVLLIFTTGTAVAADGKPVIAGDLTISAAWARATVAGAPVGAAYFTVTNRGSEADALLGASSPASASVTLHQSTQTNGMAHMHAAGELAIAPGQQLKAGPGGLHLMLNGLRQPLAAGASLPLTLKFRHAGTVSLQVQVIPITAVAP